MRVCLESLSLHPPARLLSTGAAAYFLPLILVTVLAGCFGTASDFLPPLTASPTEFLPSFCSAPLLAGGFPRFLVGDGGATGLTAAAAAAPLTV